MAANERDRWAAFERLRELLGEREAEALMEGLPPYPWHELATKSDLDQLRLATKSDLELLRLATKSDLELLRLEMKTGFAESRASMEATLRDQLKWMVTTTLGGMVALTGIFSAVVAIVR